MSDLTAKDFNAIVERLKWSWDHLERYKAALVDAGVTYHWTRTAQAESETGKYVDFVVDGVTHPPDHVKFILGDCIHSLRASLDNLIYLLCPTHRAEFLICKTPDHWKANAWKIKNLPKNPCTVLYNLQPFNMDPTGDVKKNPLVVLNDLWNADKHRVPSLVGGITDYAQIDSGDADTWAFFNSGPLDLGSVIARVWLFSEPEPDLVPAFSFDVVFDWNGPAPGAAVYPYLAHLHHVIGDIVEIFRRAVLG